MRIYQIAFFLIFSQISLAQVRVFNDNAKDLIEAKDSIYDIEEFTPSASEYDFISDRGVRLKELFLSEIKTNSRVKPDELRVSQTLMHLSDLATKAWKGSQYSDSKKWKGLSKHFHRAFNQSTSSFNYTKEISFRIPLVDHEGKRYYYDRRAEVSEINLYKGKKPTGLTKEEKEDLPDPIPLNYFTEEELVEQFYKQLKRSKVLRDLKAGRYACVGLDVELDERTIHNSKIPTARLVIVFGARRLRDIRIKEIK